LPTITAILQEAEQRALRYLATHMPESVRAVALDEIYANDRRSAYLNIVDVHSGAVWASVGPLPVDSDSWTLLLWESADHGLICDRAVMDGGAAARAGWQAVHPTLPIQSDQWHVLHTCAQIQGRLERRVRDLRERTAVVARQAARVAAGLRPKGRKADLLPLLGSERQALLGWAWLRRKQLGWSSEQLLAAIPADWQTAARILVRAWDDAVRVSTAVERWRSIQRTHLSVHRTLSVGRLALLVVWHNHRVFTCGVHKGQNPLQLSGIADAPTDWLVALGYPPATAGEAPVPIAPAVALAA
jgi:hypothetical protein